MFVDRRSVCLSAVAVLTTLNHARAAAEPIVVPIRLIGARVTIPVEIKGMIGPFAIDTGGQVNLINEDVARDLALRKGPSLQVGVASSPAMHQTFIASNLAIGGIIAQHDVPFVAVPGRILGAGIAGALSSGLITTTPCALDFDALQWRVWPDERPSFPGYVRLEAQTVGVVEGFTPLITADARVNGMPVRCVLDTGGESFVRLNRSTAERLGLWTSARPYAPVAQGGRIVRLNALDFGGTNFERPLALLLATDRLADVSGGLIGLPTLRRFNIGFDLNAGALWLRRNTQSAPEYHYALSGLFVSSVEGGLHIDDVGPQSPAASAGLAPGDVIEATDAAQIISQLNAPAGTDLTFTIRRGASRRLVSLRLSEYL